MSMRCRICGKGPIYGHKISHAHNVSKRRWNPNLRKVRVAVKGGTKSVRVCTRCIGAGKVTKSA